jgi:WhiB family redox-sensing transcriptional regulator
VNAHTTTTQPDRDWRHRAECRLPGYDPELWFPIGNTGPALLQIEEAKDVCRDRCPVVEQCLQWALDTRQESGVWGGLSEDERRRMKRRAARNRAPGAQVSREPAECGTETGARRHRRAHEAVCRYCAEAERKARRRREQQQQDAAS